MGQKENIITFFEKIICKVIQMNLERIMFIREMLELSQRELADKLNVSKSTYARWETGEKIIPLSHLIDLCNLSNSSLDYALGLTNSKEKRKNSLKINYKNIGSKIKQLREQKKLTQEEFAKSINTTQSVISEYENGLSPIQTAFLYNICIKYEVSADWIIK